MPTGLERSPVEFQRCLLGSGDGEEARRQGGEGGGGRRGELSQNLTTLTWQVGNNMTVDIHIKDICVYIYIFIYLT